MRRQKTLSLVTRFHLIYFLFRCIINFKYKRHHFGFTFTVTEFAKFTGDYTSLSATDIKVIALTYQLEKERVGTDHLRSNPTVAQTVDSNAEKAKELCTPLAGFYVPHKNVNTLNLNLCRNSLNE